MANAIIVLFNRDQKRYFSQLRDHRLPDFFGNLFEEPVRALDFLHAFSKLLDEHRDDTWGVPVVLPQVRQKALALTPDQINTLCNVATDKWVAGQLEIVSTLGLLFSSAFGDIQHAAAIMLLVSKVFLREDFYNLGDSHAFIGIVTIIATAAFTRTWTLLAEGVKKAMPEAENAFNNFLCAMAILQRHPHFVGPESDIYREVFEGQNGLEAVIDELGKHIGGVPGQNSERHRIPVIGQDHAYYCNRFAGKRAKKDAENAQRIYRLTAWFGAYEDTFQAQAANMWAEIEADTKYGLKPTGDVVKIEVKALLGNYWRYIQLLPGKDHTRFTARFWFYLPDDLGRIAIDQIMYKSRLRKLSDAAGEQDFEALTDKLQQFMGLHTYWQIVTGKAFKVRVKSTQGRETLRESLERNFLIRPHYRWLPPGHHASEEAVSRSLAGPFKAPPPPGKTFVMSESNQAHDKANASSAALDKAIFGYADEDLGYTGQ